MSRQNTRGEKIGERMGVGEFSPRAHDLGENSTSFLPKVGERTKQKSGEGVGLMENYLFALPLI